MFLNNRAKRDRRARPVLGSLEGRQLLNAAMPRVESLTTSVVVHELSRNHHAPKATPPGVTLIGGATANGVPFLNFDGPNPGTTAGAGTNMNGIANNGTSVGFVIDANGHFNNFTVNPLKSRTITPLNVNGSTNAMALGVNSKGVVVGTDGNGDAFIDSKGKVSTFIPPGGTSAVAFGINDQGTIVGQYTTPAGTTPGFVRINNGKSYVTINAPSGPDVVNAQGINANGLVVGFYVGADGQDHGFTANVKNLKGGSVTATPVADPTIPAVAGEPGATFVFSQVLGVNDQGVAVGYYGDSTASQHGFSYDTRTGAYTFLDDPSEAFNDGVEVTQITGIDDQGEIAGFYSDANGVFHGFVGTPRGR